MVQLPPKDFVLPLLKKEQLTADAHAFYFDRSQTPFDFLPGQYVRMFLDVAAPDDRGTNRMFSISSAPEEKDVLMIVTRIIQSTFKKTLVSIPVGAQVRFFGPAGRFVFEKEDPRPRVFLAGGIGITPYRSMIISAVKKNLTIPITLFASCKTPEQRIFSSEFSEIAKQYSWFHFIETVTHPEESQIPWEGMKGRINESMIETYVPDYKNAVFYTSGPAEMVNGMVELLQKTGLPQEQIKKEVFTGY